MFEGKDELTIIQDDIRRAVATGKPKWGMLIDLRRCTACNSCTVGCISEQKSPPGITYRPVFSEESGTFPNVTFRFTPRPCMQCDTPACVGVCPKAGEGGATWKSKGGLDGGIVKIDYKKCIGCGRCVVACPYKARMLDGGKSWTGASPRPQEYEKAPSYEYGKAWPREKGKSPIGKARKCHFCLHRLTAGMVPMCVSTCPCRANYFGDLDDPTSLIARVIKQHEGRIQVLKAVEGNGGKKIDPEAAPKLSTDQLATAVAYPGTRPVFSAKAVARPRVFYILP